MKKIAILAYLFVLSGNTAVAQIEKPSKFQEAIQVFQGSYRLVSGSDGCGEKLSATFSARTELGENKIVVRDVDRSASTYINDFFGESEVVSPTKMYRYFSGKYGDGFVTMKILFEKTSNGQFRYESLYDFQEEGFQSIHCSYRKTSKL